jgi:hypothetical protein
MTRKFVVVLNKSYDVSRLLSALGHVSAGLAGNSGLADEMKFITYEDKSGQTYPNISEWSFVVLKGKGSHIRKFREGLLAKQMKYACYLDTMLSGGSEVQQAATKEKPAEECEMLALATFGDAAILDSLTKRFSLWRTPAISSGTEEE